MISDIGYIINTHIHYANPLLHLLDTMWNIPRKNIIVVVASEIIGSSQQYHYVNHNSFDYTGAIALVEQRFHLPEHIAFIQDTMEFGKDTDRLFKMVDPDVQATAVFGGQCNLVVYRYDYLLGMSDFILAQRNLSKRDSIKHEGALWHKATKKKHFDNSTVQILGKERPYGNTERIKEYYTAIDLVKWKANYGQNMNALITEP